MIREILIFNPFTKTPYKILDKTTIAEKEHTHSLLEVRGLKQILNLLGVGNKTSGGYFVN